MNNFLQAAAAYPALRAEEEVELAKAIEAGLLAGERLAAGVPDPALAADYGRLVRLGRDANTRMVLANVRLAAWWASKRVLAGGNGSMSLEDLTAEGALGVVHAVEMFDFTLGFKFSTYASYWVRQRLQRAAARSTAAVVPHATLALLAQMGAAREDLLEDLGRQPSDAELAERMELTVRAVRDLQRVQRTAMSLDADLGAGAGNSVRGRAMTLADGLADAERVDETVCDLDLPLQVHRLLSNLTPRERRVVALRFGMGGHEPHDVAETARALAVDEAMVRAALAGALTKLRSADGVEELHVYLEQAA